MSAKLMRQAEAGMRQAEKAGDLDAWCSYYKTWLKLVPLRIREGRANQVTSQGEGETRLLTPDDGLYFHPLVG